MITTVVADRRLCGHGLPEGDTQALRGDDQRRGLHRHPAVKAGYRHARKAELLDRGDLATIIDQSPDSG